MAKVYHVTLVLEVENYAEEPENWNWYGLLAEVPYIRGFSIIEFKRQPYSSMEDDPTHHTHH